MKYKSFSIIYDIYSKHGQTPLTCLRQGKLGGAFNDLGEVAEKSPEFGELAPNEPRKPNFFTGLRDLAPQFPGLPQFGGNKNNKSPARKTFGAPFGQSPQVIGPIGPQNRPSITNNFNNNAETDVEIFSQVLFLYTHHISANCLAG